MQVSPPQEKFLFLMAFNIINIKTKKVQENVNIVDNHITSGTVICHDNHQPLKTLAYWPRLHKKITTFKVKIGNGSSIYFSRMHLNNCN
jgi:hypothetical protein